jgi:outer membrane receptor protein involved in Fe transport
VNDNIDLLFGAGNLTSLTQTGLSARNVPIGTNYRLFAKYAFIQGPLRGLYIGGGVQHNGPRALTATNNGYLPAYTTGSGLAGYNWGRHWQIQLNVTNITNALYPAYGIAVNTIMPSNPRDYSGILTYSY